MGYIIRRNEVKVIKSGKSWLLIYGRRKTGKTFLLRNLCNFKNYFLVKKNLSVFFNDRQIALVEMSKKARDLLNADQTVVIDEFQRLNESFLEEFTLLHPKGRLILSGSSMSVIKKFFEPNSVLLGFFTPLKIGFISPVSIIVGLKGKTDPAKTIALASFLREPWLIPLFEGEDLIDLVYKIVTKAKFIVPALLGEVFSEEGRELSRKYEGIISLIGSGTWKTKEIASILYTRGLIPDANVTNIMQYIKNLEEMGVVEAIKIFNLKSNFYRLSSPIMNIYYYLDSRYDISNRNISLEEIRPTLERLINLEIQNFIAGFFAEKYNGRKEYYLSPNKELDFIITKRNKLKIIGEVKWKGANMQDLLKFRKNTQELFGKKIIVFKSGRVEDSINAQDVVKMCTER